MAKRPPIPVDLERAVLVECGHRCAIPMCRQVPVEIAHIIAWAKCKVHTFGNLIALCPTCHTRYDSGVIDRKAMQIYKLKLQHNNSRYGDLEKRVLGRFAKDRHLTEIWLLTELEIMVEYLLEDGLLEDAKETRSGAGGLPQKLYKLTKQGQELIAHWPLT